MGMGWGVVKDHQDLEGDWLLILVQGQSLSPSDGGGSPWPSFGVVKRHV